MKKVCILCSQILLQKPTFGSEVCIFLVVHRKFEWIFYKLFLAISNVFYTFVAKNKYSYNYANHW